MRRLSRFAPILVGLVLGYLLMSPPEWLAPLGPWRWPAIAAIVLLGLLAFTAWQLSANLPADPPLEPADEGQVSGELRDLCSRLEALGFQRIGTPLTVGVSPPALMVAFVHEAEGAYATAFRTSTLPPKTAFDCVSILDGDCGGLTTGAEPAGAVIPAAPGSLRQVFPRASVEQVFERHRLGLQHLRSRGLSARAVSASSFPRDFATSFRRQREAFTASPLRGAAITLWRAATGRTPHIGPIASQAVAQATIRELLTGARAHLVSLVLALTGVASVVCGATPPGERVLRTQQYRELQGRLARGWNTWNTASVLSHAHLPEGFAITLGLKNSGTGLPYQRDFFQANPTLKRNERIRLGPHADDGSYTELRMGWGAGNDYLVQSATEGDDLFILITVKARDRLRPAHLYVEAGFLWNRPGVVVRSGDVLRGEGGGRVFEVRQTAREVGDPFGTTNTPYLSAALDGELAIHTGAAKSLAEVEVIVARRQAEQAARPRAWGEHAELFTAMQTILAWNLVYDPENDRAISPVSRLWNVNWGGYVLFDWDTYFAAFMYSLYSEDLAYANAIEVTKGWTRRGFVPNFASAYGLKSEDRSQPPVGSLMALEVYKRHRKPWFLEEVYVELLAWNRWWPGARECQGVLCWGSDPETQTLDGTTHNWQAALYESGLDNSPMYDGVPFNAKTNLLEQADVGLTALYVADCRALAEIATILGRPADATELRARGEKYATALRGLWDEKAGIYLNRRTDTGEASAKLSPTSFYPLIAGVPTPAQAARMAREHYFNPAELHGDWVIPSIARNVPGFDDQDYWRGRIWGPMNFLVYLGLRNYDLPDARADLVRRSRELLLKSWRSDGAIYENYNAVTGRGDDVTSSDAFYHWGALLGVISLLEEGR